MTKADDLLTLAERVEATGPDRELDGDIHCEVHGYEKRWNDKFEAFQYWRDGRWIGLGSITNYTSSLDAAMSLADGQRWCGGAPALLHEAGDRLYRSWAAQDDEQRRRNTWPPESLAYREALARFMTAACLRALAVQENEK